MKKIRITPIKRVEHKDLMEKYENPIKNACDIIMGKEYISENGKMPQDFCCQAWQSIYPFAFALANGGENFFDGWMKNKKTAMISCNDGFRPVSFLLEVVD